MLHDFFTLDGLTTGESTAACTVSFSPQHPVFQGHFPGQPVVPGVCTMHITSCILEKVVGRRLRVAESRQMKFLQLLTPEMRPSVTLAWTIREDGRVGLESTWLIDERPVFKFSGILAG